VSIRLYVGLTLVIKPWMDGRTDGDLLTVPLPPAAVDRLTFITIAALHFQVHTHEQV